MSLYISNKRIYKIKCKSMDESKSDESSEESWTDDIELILKNVNNNADYLQEEHRKVYLHMKCQLYYYRIPIIIFSSLNSVFSVGLSKYIHQETTSAINCLISLLCACISAVELFIGINKSLDSSLASYHGYKILTIKISACLKLSRLNRDMHGIPFLKEVLTEYSNLLEQSIVILPFLDDTLVKIDNVPNPLLKRSSNLLYGLP
jgi:hypothetical protein